MQSLLKSSISFFIAAVAFAQAAQATILVNPPLPYPQAQQGDTGLSVYYAGSGSATVNNLSVNTTRGYRVINTGADTADANLIWIDVTSTDAGTAGTSGTNTVITLSTSTTTGSEVPLRGAGIVNGNVAPPPCSAGGCQGTSFKSAIYSAGQVIRISFSLTDLCATTGTLGTLCTGGNAFAALTTVTPTTLTQQIYVSVGAADITTGIGPISSSFAFTLGVTNVPPVLNCPSTEFQYYFPGDEQIYLKPDGFGISASSGVTLQDLLFMAKPGGTADTGPAGVASNPIVGYQSYTNQSTVKGFDNAQIYGAITYAENIAGILSGAPLCTLSTMQSRAIKGVLTESKCFIATAAFQDGHAAPVMMLRKFRDQVLAKSEFGRDFIHTYYQYSPALAEWAWDKPIIRSIALRALAPVEFLAWAWLKVSHAEDTGQPYIDRLKKQLEEEDSKNGGAPASSQGYSEQIKKKLSPTPSAAGDSYIDRVKKDLPPVEGSENYSEKTKADLPPVTERESPITTVKEHRDRKLGRGDVKPIENAVSFKLGVTPGMEVVNNSGGGHTFNEVYNSDWKPDFILHFEHQFMHSENFGSLGASVDLGVNYAAGYGLFDTPFNGSTKSITTFTFVQIPLIFSAYYRFNLARILRPYVGAGVGSVFYTEIRNDDKKDQRGYSFVYTTSLGMSLLLDFLDTSTARDSYLSMGIQHTYLFAEYMYLNSLPSSSVTIKRAGVYMGFLFEI